MNILKQLFGHECKFNEVDVILDSYKDSLKRIYEKQGLTPYGWNIVKDYAPKCIYCGKKLPSDNNQIQNNEKPVFIPSNQLVSKGITPVHIPNKEGRFGKIK